MGTSVSGMDDGSGFGVKGSSSPPHTGRGVEGISKGGDGVFGQTRGIHAAGVRGVHEGHISAIAVIGELKQGTTAVKGQQGGGSGVGGDEVTGSGVWGDSTNGVGVVGTSSTSDGILGEGATFGVHGISVNGEGVHGETNATNFSPGVSGISLNREGWGPGVLGQSNGAAPGVLGKSLKDAGVIGFHGDPHLEETVVRNDSQKAGVFGASDVGAGIVGYSRSFLAGLFLGSVQVNGDLFLPGADCAEHFLFRDAQDLEAGSVVVIDQEGALKESTQEYDKKVAGVISGAGSYRPGIVLDHQTIQQNRLPVALMGKVYCKVDAQYAPIVFGDLLTTSPTRGHAMKVTDSQKAFGAVIGKALGSFHGGKGLVPMLVCMG
jgi:hypothetical protein